MSTPTELSGSSASATSVMSYRESVVAALDDALAEDPSVFVLGEDVASGGGVWKTTLGLEEKYGRDRVWNTPICENGFLGVALGLAVTGMRPVAEIMFADFLPTGADAMINEIPKFRFMSGGNCKVPVTIRTVGGAGMRFGTQHSATGESWFLQVPGLRLAVASGPDTAYGLLRAAIRDDNPVLVYEHKSLLNRKGDVTRGESGIAEIGKAATLREGNDLTIVATLAMVERALQAAEMLSAEGIEAEVIDLRWLRPLDVPTCIESVGRTGRLVVVEEEYHHGSWGTTLISKLTLAGTRWKSPPRVASFPDELQIPYSPPLEDEMVPSAESIFQAGRDSIREMGR